MAVIRKAGRQVLSWSRH